MSHFNDLILKSIQEGDLEEFKTLLQGKNVNIPLADGWTLLHHVCIEGQDSFLEYLFSRGAAANCDFEFFTPLMAVCSSRSAHEDNLVKCAKTLIAHKANLEAKDKTKVTALMFACNNGHEKLIRLLLESQCDVNQIDNDGFSALHLACMYNYPNIVQILLEYGAVKQIKDRRGRFPIDLAIAKGADDIIQFLDDSKPIITEIECPPIYEAEKSQFEKLLTQLPSFTNSSGKDGFHQDVETLLSGVRLEQATDLFLKKNVSLSQFLNITNDELKTLGLYFSSHRSRVITGNKRFICKGWGEYSLPPENNNVSIMDVCRALANSVKHLHILFCSSLYSNNRVILPSENSEEKKVGDLFEITLRAHRQTKLLIKELKLIQERADHLEKIHKVKPVDLVLPSKPSVHYSRNFFLVTAVCALLVWKSNLFNVFKK